ncbi:MAG: FliA/WhiG family RNA polymerase sigma factor [Gammaproteobacteria bacterium]|nr:FliA/WhiG family RNA polymerase sigma factor [Gammaproteobacteria bacterium]MBU1553345.1 FliA/WhiG family RNA polymerase sigma factor [Gammaproteobacteria bacterium]MBU2070789.1 FliA/WhiG family RNA polymerase sigma factor [Gammaproteobacteria bacterium]MBU2182780.1 FliA/WhiG family RNA polymerase sigma factor [Gammaproteobacteria bacterium]MBU2205978.1 FliA/WhiG family RNA polymerase sigma factor [Gammaproteobacteria bacterium]
MLALTPWPEPDNSSFTLSPAQESRLLQRYSYLVKRAAAHLRSLVGSMVDKDDLQQIGLMGLLSALRRYGREVDEQFESYAFKRIRGAMLDEFRRIDWRPRQLRQQAHQLRDKSRELTRELGRVPTDDELCAALDIDQQTFLELQYVGQAEAMESLDLLLEQQSESQLGSTSLNQLELKLSLKKAMASLPERNKLLLQLYYSHELNMKEIALVLQLTESRVCQLHKQSVELLSKKLAQW